MGNEYIGNNVVLKCMDCGSILVISNKDLWHTIQCSRCNSFNIVNLDDEFDQVEMMEDE